MTQAIVILILCAYLLGSIPFSQLITHWRTGVNLREVGEGNVGSRNVWHVVGPGWGLLAAGLDTMKGLLAFEVGAAAHVPVPGMLLAGVAVVLGHQFPLFLRGQGGKGLATALGVLLGITPLSTVGGLGVLGLAYAALRDFNPALTLGTIAVIVLPVVFRQPLWVSAYALGIALLLGLKKLLDRPHEQRVWASHPWQGPAAPGWQREATDEPPAPDVHPH
jgi:acyl phosphate:glycerol-3-phosphate acyltransferase